MRAASKFERDPQKRRGDSASRVLPVARRTSINAQPKEPKVSPSTRLNPISSSVGARGGHVAVAQHGVANPVAVAHVPEHAAEICKQKRAAQGPAATHGFRAKQIAHSSGTSPNQANMLRQGGMRPAIGNGSSSSAAERTGSYPTTSLIASAYRVEFKASDREALIAFRCVKRTRAHRR